MDIPSAGKSFESAESFDLGDAFNDGDDDDHNNAYKFSPEAIRKEMHMTRHSDDGDGVISRNAQAFRDLDESVSTLDINGDARSSATSPPPTPDESDTTSQFVQISLSSSETDISAHESQNPLELEKGHISTEEIPHEDEQHPYPTVIIDVSKPPSHRVTLSTESATNIPTPSTATHPPLSPPSSSNETDKAHSDHSTQSAPSNSLRAQQESPHAASTSALPSPSLVVPSQVEASASLSSTTTKSTHRYTRSVGPSTFEKVRSRTRPSFLPPKSREEDDKHMADWEAMMKLSRAAAVKKRKALQERRLAREKKIEDSLHYWEKEIVLDWRVVLVNPGMRKVWWRGIPTKLRAFMWERAVGNPLALSKDNYKSCSARAKRALNSGSFPAATLATIEEDIGTTLPGLHIFHHETGPLYADLKDMLCAWVVARSDEGLGYTYGASKIAAMFLLNMPPQQGFVVMRNMLERHCMRSFFGGDGAKDDVEAYYRIFDTLLADGMPKIYFNFKQHQISPAAYLPEWIIPLFLDHLPFEACARIWDVLMLEGDAFLYRAALGILAVLEPRLFFPDRKELIELLKGENKAALDVAKRDGQRLDGGKYEIYGVDEETLWERIDSMDDWWKESTWNRLIQRELPDR
ncbi:tbc1 domain family member 14 [Moniliophthora roreri MCA 2997]|uniref:Tbc1 domain family member 14 n=1 Tax=Moniliophthora roreri (strain MCA 2997) TaxID=1381753 RepID=V2XEJ0_MONRO|nr:tbc1 domain family member 14 [Moniliophthora roreri MCA 2997]